VCGVTKALLLRHCAQFVLLTFPLNEKWVSNPIVKNAHFTLSI